MSERADYLIVGSGLTGATMARLLTDAGQRVLIVERRAHWGGNVHETIHACGIPYHTYGPHYFRTNSKRIWNFVNRFAAFAPFTATLKTDIDGAYENYPVNAQTVERYAGKNWQPEFVGIPENFEQACLAAMPRVVYEKFIKGYTEKQWGVAAHTLSPALANRVPVHARDEVRLSRYTYQGLPARGYTEFMRALLQDIPLCVNTDYLKQREAFTARKKIIFTGPIDEYFDFDLGRLRYRAQRRAHTVLPNTAFAQPVVQINNPAPENGAHIRTIEWKHLLPPAVAEKFSETLLSRETPYTAADPDAYEYPFPDAPNAALYTQYQQRAQQIPNVLICGRLGEYRYLDMDQAIARAMLLANRLLQDKTYT